ncbi:hypothetical protein MTR_2g054150 [Medicago truncatula]|uniref:Uncharacterized protein n=1 Tax=Medicago truncatula TaxID=3880 RepID=G7IQI7_MEDTR|nr:hypothetical protein MTR_2g054150 [Medicago truncatula]
MLNFHLSNAKENTRGSSSIQQWHPKRTARVSRIDQGYRKILQVCDVPQCGLSAKQDYSFPRLYPVAKPATRAEKPPKFYPADNVN